MLLRTPIVTIVYKIHLSTNHILVSALLEFLWFLSYLSTIRSTELTFQTQHLCLVLPEAFPDLFHLPSLYLARIFIMLPTTLYYNYLFSVYIFYLLNGDLNEDGTVSYSQHLPEHLAQRRCDQPVFGECINEWEWETSGTGFYKSKIDEDLGWILIILLSVTSLQRMGDPSFTWDMGKHGLHGFHLCRQIPEDSHSSCWKTTAVAESGRAGKSLKGKRLAGALSDLGSNPTSPSAPFGTL